MNLSKLSPAPWAARIVRGEFVPMVEHSRKANGTCGCVCMVADQDTAEFIALARNAFDVMLRLGWSVSLVDVCPAAGKIDMKWMAFADDVPVNGLIWADDPFSALVEAERWHRENVEKQ